METIFHKILAREIPADIVFENDDVLGFRDIHPKANTHILFIPKTFVESIAHITDDNEHAVWSVIRAAQEFAQEKGIAGYSIKFHVGKDGGQEVPYLHLHFLSDQTL